MTHFPSLLVPGGSLPTQVQCAAQRAGDRSPDERSGQFSETLSHRAESWRRESLPLGPRTEERKVNPVVAGLFFERSYVQNVS